MSLVSSCSYYPVEMKSFGALKKSVVLIGLPLVLALNACSPRDASVSSVEKPVTLFDGLSINAIDRMVISDRKGRVVLCKKGAEWTVGESVIFPVHMPMLIQFLVQLEQARLGQRMSVSEKDYAYLSLLDPLADNLPEEVNPIKVELFSGSANQTNRFILGAFDIPDDEKSVMFTGEKGSARRFVRLMNGRDAVYLSSDPLYYAVPSSNMWIIRKFFPTNGVKEIKGTSGGNEKWSIRRKSAFGKLELSGLPEGYTLTPAQVAVFNNLFGSGSFAGIVPQGREAEFMQEEKRRELEVVSFDGRIHKAEIGRLIEPVDYRDPAEKLQEGIISFAPVETGEKKEAYVVRIRAAAPTVNEADLALIKLFEDRAIIIEGRDVSPLLELFETAENQADKIQGESNE